MLMGHNFREFNFNSTVMIVVEGQNKLGDDAHRYYDSIIHKLQQDPAHIQHIQDFWGDPFTAAGAQSADAKGAYVMLNLARDRAMGGSGGVVTAAGLVFAVTMASMLGSDLRIIAQLGSTIAIGLLLDTLIVRSLLMPSIATLLGRWFWWPQVIYPYGDPNLRRIQQPTDDTDTAPVPTQR